jgi:branched-chain amino acid aminotransferase
MICLNGHIYDKIPKELDLALRAVYYGDVLFETIRVFERGRIPLLERHLQRLKKGMDATGMEWSEHWDLSFFTDQILALFPENARLRLTVWRSPGGLYLPENQGVQWLLSGTFLPETQWKWREKPLLVGICEGVRLPSDAFSFAKALNAPRYVQAAREAAAKGWDEGLLQNAWGRVAEACSSNLFWWEGEQLFTVDLSEGCVEGVFRGWLLDAFEVNIDTAPPERLAAADELFLTNAVRGILPASLGDKKEFPLTYNLFERVALW